jgi:hypothetical protein
MASLCDERGQLLPSPTMNPISIAPDTIDSTVIDGNNSADVADAVFSRHISTWRFCLARQYEKEHEVSPSS